MTGAASSQNLSEMPRRRVTFLQASMAGALALAVTSWAFVLRSDSNLTTPFFSLGTLESLWGFAKDLLGVGSTSDRAFAQLGAWRETGLLAYETLAMSVLGIGIAGIIAGATFMFGARNVMTGDLVPHRSRLAAVGFWATRLFFLVARGVPELVWAMLIIFVLSPGILPGAIALGIHNGGILGKLASEVVEGMDTRPVRALESTGAGRFQVLLYGVLPETLPSFLTYLLYRWEVIIRTTIVVGFVAAGGLGQEFRFSMSHFHYTSVTLVIMWYLILVLCVDLAAAFLRRLAR